MFAPVVHCEHAESPQTCEQPHGTHEQPNALEAGHIKRARRAEPSSYAIMSIHRAEQASAARPRPRRRGCPARRHTASAGAKVELRELAGRARGSTMWRSSVGVCSGSAASADALVGSGWA